MAGLHAAGVTRVLLTGMSGVGKSAVVRELGARGYRALDADCDEWSEWVAADGNPTGAREGADWVWREDRMERLLTTEDGDALFVAGCAANMGRFLERFDHVVLLSAPAETLLARVARRGGDRYGKRAEEAAAILRNQQEVEPLLRRVASHEVDAALPLSRVVAEILAVLDRPR